MLYTKNSSITSVPYLAIQEQKVAIIRYAEKNQLNIIQWFEEQETAAKQGRPLFTKMMKLLRRGDGQGVIIHKIDRRSYFKVSSSKFIPYFKYDNYLICLHEMMAKRYPVSALHFIT